MTFNRIFGTCIKMYRCKDVLFYPSTQRLLGFVQRERNHKGTDDPSINKNSCLK